MNRINKTVQLYDHNKAAFNQFEEELKNKKLIMIESCPGSGKSYITLKYLQEHPEETLVVCPKRAIAGEWEHYGGKYGLSISTMTYQKLCKLSVDELVDLAKHYPYIIYDECHHLGAPVWKRNPEWLKQNCTDNIYIGLTATPIRYLDGGMNICEEFFDGNSVKGITSKQAIETEVLPGFKYVCGLFGSREQLSEIKNQVRGKKELCGQLDDQLRRLEYCVENRDEVCDAFDQYMPDGDRKGIVFADRIDNLDNAESIMRDYFGEAENYFTAHSLQNSAENARAIESFKQVDHGWLFVVDMLNEGLHVPGVNTVVMFRKTSSPGIYIQQLGRSQASGGEEAVIFDFVGNYKGLKTAGISGGESDGTGEGRHYIPESRVIVNFVKTEGLQVLEEVENILNPSCSTDKTEPETENNERDKADYLTRRYGNCSGKYYRNYFELQKESMWYNPDYYCCAYIDTRDYLADKIFATAGISPMVMHREESPNLRFTFVYCRVDKHDIRRFNKAMEQLKAQMALTLGDDYSILCQMFWDELDEQEDMLKIFKPTSQQTMAGGHFAFFDSFKKERNFYYGKTD